jgi:hypothetical protein
MTPPEAILAGEGEFPVSRCARCAREVLTHVHVEAGTAHRLCLHCDAEIDPAEVRWVSDTVLASLGYGLEDDEVGGCGRPGCGRGNCANRR